MFEEVTVLWLIISKGVILLWGNAGDTADDKPIERSDLKNTDYITWIYNN